MSRSLLVAIGNLEQRLLAPWASKNLEPGRQRTAGKAHRHRQGREAGRWREAIAVVSVRAVEVADQPRRIVPGRVDQGVHPRAIHDVDYALRKMDPVADGILTFRISVQRRFGLRVKKVLENRRMEFL